MTFFFFFCDTARGEVQGEGGRMIKRERSKEERSVKRLKGRRGIRREKREVEGGRVEKE